MSSTISRSAWHRSACLRHHPAWLWPFGPAATGLRCGSSGGRYRCGARAAAPYGKASARVQKSVNRSRLLLSDATGHLVLVRSSTAAMQIPTIGNLLCGNKLRGPSLQCSLRMRHRERDAVRGFPDPARTASVRGMLHLSNRGRAGEQGTGSSHDRPEKRRGYR